MKKMLSVLLVGLMLFGLTSCGGSSNAYEKPLATFYKAIEDKDFDKMVSVFTETEKEYFEMAAELSSKEELMATFFEGTDGNVKISFKIAKSTEVKSEELEEMKVDYENIEQAFQLEVETTVKTSADKETSSETITVIKIGGKWYLSMV